MGILENLNNVIFMYDIYIKNHWAWKTTFPQKIMKANSRLAGSKIAKESNTSPGIRFNVFLSHDIQNMKWWRSSDGIIVEKGGNAKEGIVSIFLVFA